MVKNKIDPCMFCDAVPCECNVKKTPAKKVLPSQPVSVPSTKLKVKYSPDSTVAKNLLATSQSNPSLQSTSVPLKKPNARAQLSTDDSVLVTALQNLREILSTDTLEKYSRALGMELTMSEKLAAWKEMSRNGQNG